MSTTAAIVAASPRVIARPARDGVAQFRNLALSFSYPSFPRKREPRDLRPLAPLFKPGAGLWVPPSRGRRIGLSAGFPDSLRRRVTAFAASAMVVLLRQP